jgi:hypothetical protein
MYIGLRLLSVGHVSILLHPIVHLDPLLASIKGRARALMQEGGRAGLSLSPSRTLVTPTASSPTLAQDNMKSRFSPLCVPSRANPSGLGHVATIYSSVQGPPGVETPTKGKCTLGPFLFVLVIKCSTHYYVLTSPRMSMSTSV